MNQQQNHLVIINPDSTQGKTAISFFRKRGVRFVVSERKGDMSKHVLQGVKDGVRTFFVVSGDGGLCACVQSLMTLPARVRNQVSIGIIPGGKANDGARHLGIPLSVELAYEALKKGVVRRVDVVRVNKKYFVTGGGFGLTPEVIEGVDRLSARPLGRLLNKVHRGVVYQLVVLGKALFGFRGLQYVWVDGEFFDALMLVAVMNQPFHGKSYVLAPGARSDDGLVDVVVVRAPKGVFGRLKTLRAVSCQDHLGLAGSKRLLKKRFVVRCSRPCGFVGDGEFLGESEVFEFEVYKEAIGLMVPAQ